MVGLLCLVSLCLISWRVDGLLSSTIGAWKKGFFDSEKEYTMVLHTPELPQDLKGTLFRSHLGGIKQGLNTITHPFDADGMVSAITFNYPNILLRSRYVQTEGRIADTSLGQFTSRGVFGTPRHGGWLNNIFRIGLKNVANTNAQTWGNRVLALWEGGRPYSLHPDSLQTRKPDRFDNLFNNRRPLSAHGRVDHENQRYLTYSVEIITPNRVKVHTYEISPQYEILRTRSDLLSGFGLFHDFAFTQDYFVFIQAPLSFNVLPFLFGLKGPAECVETKSGCKANLVLIPRSNKKDMKIIPFDSPLCVLHFANAFQDEDTITIDCIHNDHYEFLASSDPKMTPLWDHVDFDRDVPRSTLVRYEVNLAEKQGRVVPKKSILVPQEHLDFPTIHPHQMGKKHRYIYGAVSGKPGECGPAQGIVRVDTVTRELSRYYCATDSFLSEAIVAPKSSASNADEDDAYLVCLEHHPMVNSCDLLVFEASNISAGPLSRIDLKGPLPYSLHGSFSTTSFGFE